MTQKERIKEILLRDGRVDNFYCIDNRITIRLGAIIERLRHEGWEITGDYLEGTKNFCYTLVREKTLDSAVKEKIVEDIHALCKKSRQVDMRDVRQASLKL